MEVLQARQRGRIENREEGERGRNTYRRFHTRQVDLEELMFIRQPILDPRILLDHLWRQLTYIISSTL